MQNESQQWWVPKPISNKFKIFNEGMTTVILIGMAIGTCYLAIYHLLPPWLLFLIVIIHIFCCFLTRIDNKHPNPWHHFNRNLEGIVVISTPWAALFYYVTWFSEGLASYAQFRAELLVVYAYFMLIWVWFAEIPYIGIYFVIRIWFFWSRLFIAQYGFTDPPFMFLISSFFCSLLALGPWITSSITLTNTLLRREYFGEQTTQYRRVAAILLPMKIIIGIILIIYEIPLANFILANLPLIEMLHFSI